jgi:hypothetical protein
MRGPARRLQRVIVEYKNQYKSLYLPESPTGRDVREAAHAQLGLLIHRDWIMQGPKPLRPDGKVLVEADGTTTVHLLGGTGPGGAAGWAAETRTPGDRDDWKEGRPPPTEVGLNQRQGNVVSRQRPHLLGGGEQTLSSRPRNCSALANERGQSAVRDNTTEEGSEGMSKRQTTSNQAQPGAASCKWLWEEMWQVERVRDTMMQMSLRTARDVRTLSRVCTAMRDQCHTEGAQRYLALRLGGSLCRTASDVAHGNMATSVTMEQMSSKLLRECAHLGRTVSLFLHDGFKNPPESLEQESDLVVHLINSLPCLRTLDISWCPFTTDGLLQQVAEMNRV